MTTDSRAPRTAAGRALLEMADYGEGSEYERLIRDLEAEAMQIGRERHRAIQEHSRLAEAAADPVAGEQEAISRWLASPDTEQLFANALTSWPPTAKPNEYVAIWRRMLATLLLNEVRARMTAAALPTQASEEGEGE